MEFSSTHTWFDKKFGDFPAFPELCADSNVDVCIIGAGFTAVSAAYHLSAKGKSVIVVEPGKIGFGCSGRTGSLIDQGINAEYEDIADIVGPASARRLWKECLAGRDELANLLSDKIEADLSINGVVQCVMNRKNEAALNKRAVHFSAVDHDEVRYLSEDKIDHYIGSEAILKAATYVRNGTLDPLKAFFGLVELCRKQGVEFYERTAILDIKTKNSENIIKTPDGLIKCKDLIITGNAYMTDVDSPEKTRTLNTNFYQLVTKPMPEAEIKKAFKHASAMVDSRYLSECIQVISGNRLMIGGADYMEKSNDIFVSRMIERIEFIFPHLKEHLDVEYVWRGPVGVPMNYMPVFDKMSENAYVTHGYNGHGLTLDFVGGKAISSAILGDTELLESLGRIRHMEMPEFIHRTLAKLSLMYYRIRDRFLR